MCTRNLASFINYFATFFIVSTSVFEIRIHQIQLCFFFMHSPLFQGKELPTLKDIDFLNINQKVYISEEAKKDFMEKLKRDVEVL